MPFEKSVDIVFVHGLFGDHLSTWSYEDETRRCLWPKEILGKELWYARILALEYSPTFDDFFHEEGAARHASGLLTAIGAFRDETKTKDRPMILVAHSFGGLVCACALLQDGENILRDNVQNVLFFGTPLMEAEDIRWAELQQNTFKLLCARSDSSPSTRPSPTSPGSGISNLQEIATQFGEYLAEKPQDRKGAYCVFKFFSEEIPMRELGVVLVEEDSTIPAGCYQGSAMCLNGNHLSICKDISQSWFINVLDSFLEWMSKHRNMEISFWSTVRWEKRLGEWENN